MSDLADPFDGLALGSQSAEMPRGMALGQCPGEPLCRGEALELRSGLDCWACAVLLTAHNILVTLLNVLLIVTVFGSILLPASIMVTIGLLCHSQ
ncbi:hypothetical protein chiPu_0026676, partial [Chiloscyllium punctatum]|nr:hypothetical protein [Chiloscyllium punctatum]